MQSILNMTLSNLICWRSIGTAAIAIVSLSWAGLAGAQNVVKEDAAISAEVLELTSTFNDDTIPFNDQVIVLGKADAPLTSVLVYGLSGDASDLVTRWLPEIVSKYVTSGKMKLVVVDFPLTWHDMQALAGFRCVAADKHWELLQAAVRYHSTAHYMKQSSVMQAPDHIWRVMKDFGVSREAAEKCMRNNAIVGHIEAQRQIVTDTWKTTVAPTFVVGDKVLINPGRPAMIEEAIEAALKGGR